MQDVVADAHAGAEVGVRPTHVQVVGPEGRPMVFRVPSGVLRVGRDDGCDLALPGDTVSRLHCVLVKRRNGWWVEDHSRHGTWVGEERVDAPRGVGVGDVLSIGVWRLRLSADPEAVGSTRTRAARPADHEVIAEASDGTVARAFLKVKRGEYLAARFWLDRGVATLGGPGSDLVVDPSLPPKVCTVRVVRARVMVQPHDRPVYVGGHRVRATMPVWEGETLSLGDVVLAVGSEVVRPEEDAPVLDGLVGESAVMRRVRQQIARVARHEAPVLLLGATGTGKEAAARAVHEAGPRAEGPFVAVNAGALPEALVESELFGHAAGAFTGAVAARRGAFEEADGGTLFLDEVGELSPGAQAALLRVLETGEVRPVGGGRVTYPDVRVVGATHRDLHALVDAGGFRADLLHRLAVLPVGLPALAQHLDDLADLVGHLLEGLAPGATISPAALEVLRGHDWPGNVRELRNVLTRAVVHGGDRVKPEHIQIHPAAFAAVRASGPAASAEEVQRRELEDLLRACKGSKAEAARRLGVPRTSLLYRLRKHGLG